MLNYQNKTLTKLISLILAQIFLFTEMICQEAAYCKNTSSIYIQAKHLRVPIMGASEEGINRHQRALEKITGPGTSLKVFNGFERFVNLRKPGDLFERLGGIIDIRKDERFRHVIPLLLAEKESLKNPKEPSKAADPFYQYPTNCVPCSVHVARILKRYHFKAEVKTIEFPKEAYPDLKIDRHGFVITEIAGKEFIIDLAADQFEPLGEKEWADLGVVVLPVEVVNQNPERFWMYMMGNRLPSSKPTLEETIKSQADMNSITRRSL